MPDSAEERLVLRALAALIGFMLAAATAVALVRSDEQSVAPEGPVVDGEPSYSAGGPLPGADVAAYVAGRSAVLDRLEGRVTAVVSFRGYQVEDEARRVVAGFDVLGLLVAPPGGAPAVAAGPLDDWAARARADAEAELADLSEMLETTEDPAFRAAFEADRARLRAMLERLDPRAALVFGAVVSADAGALPALAQRDDVRLVDVVSEGEPQDVTLLVGLRPEETARAGTPRTRPLS